MSASAKALLAIILLSATAGTSLAGDPVGNEFTVNTYSTGSQEASIVAQDPNGGFVAVWIDHRSSPEQIWGRRFGVRALPLGLEFRVNDATTAREQDPRVAIIRRDRFVVVWGQRVPSNNDPDGVHGRVFEGSGVPVGAEFRVSASTSAFNPSVAVSRGGAGLAPAGFVVTWHGAQDGDGTAILARRFDQHGTPLGAEFVVNTYTAGDQLFPSVAAGDGGDFVIVWTSNGQNNPRRGMFGQRFDAAGQRSGSEFMVNTYTTGDHRYGQVAVDMDGNFVVVWQEQPVVGQFVVTGRRFAGSGAPMGQQFAVATGGFSYPLSVVADRAGNFVVTWPAVGLDGEPNMTGVALRRFAADGTPRFPVFQANTFTTGPQAHPSVSSDDSGNLTVSWMSPDFLTTFDIKGRAFGGIFPAGMQMSDTGGVANGVLEVGENFILLTSWRNLTGLPQDLDGEYSALRVPNGLTVQLPAFQTAYDGIPDGGTGTCDLNLLLCMRGALSGTRPPGHQDLYLLERIVGPVNFAQTTPWAVHIGESFTDVPPANPFYRFIETLLHRGVTSGCAAGAYCPAGSTTREQMAVFVLVAKEGAGYAPPACATSVFGDVPVSSPFCRWIEELARRGVTGGCGGGNYCPTAAVSREQMAVFVLRTLDPNLNPPACAPPNLFNDVPETSAFCRWIEELARRGITGGCGGGNYCPTSPVTREQMAVFLTGTFGLTLYGT